VTASTLPTLPTRGPVSTVGRRGRLTRQRVAWLGIVAVLVLLAVWCGWLLYSDLNAVIGRRAFVYAVLFAFVPVVPMVAVFYWLDRLRPEPRALLLFALAWGALIATYVSLRINGWLAGDLGDRFGASARSAVFVAPWVEEACKATVIFAIVWWRRHDFNGVIAGVVYGGLTGIGFAFTENIVYYGQIFQHVHDLGNDNGAAIGAVQSLFLWRGVAAPFIHPMFTMMTGIGIGIAVRYRNVGVRILAPTVGYLTAVLLHMGYNTAASFAVGRALVAVYVGMLVPTLFVVTAIVAWASRHQRLVIAARLHDYTAYGWLKADHIPFLVSRRERAAFRRQAKALGSQELLRVRTLQRAAVDLGTLRDRLVRGVVSDGELARESQLVATLRDLLSRVVLPDGQQAFLGVASTGSSW
jgi:RsiW-degrading membrane proteinase PrsW (M82 family)